MNNIDNEMSLGDVARLFGGVVMNKTLTERLGVAVIDGRKVADDDANDFKEVVASTFGVDVSELFAQSGSAWVDDTIFIGADVPAGAKDFVMYHEYKHYLDYVGRGIVPSDEQHASIRSSRIEKECDIYALQRVIRESGIDAAEKALEWMINYHFQWDVDHPDDPSDLLYRAILLYRFVRRQGRAIRPKANMIQLQKSQRWWR